MLERLRSRASERDVLAETQRFEIEMARKEKSLLESRVMLSRRHRTAASAAAAAAAAAAAGNNAAGGTTAADAAAARQEHGKENGQNVRAPSVATKAHLQPAAAPAKAPAQPRAKTGLTAA